MDYEASPWPLTPMSMRSGNSLRPYLPLPGARRTVMQTKNINNDLQVPEYASPCLPSSPQSFPSVDPGLLRDEPGLPERPFLPPKPPGVRGLPPYKSPPPLPETLPPGSLPPTDTSLGNSKPKPLWTNTSAPRSEMDGEAHPHIPHLSQAMKQHRLIQNNKDGTMAPPPLEPKVDAWVQDEKGPKPNMTEKLGSLQNRLRSLLIHGPADGRRSQKVTQLTVSKSPGGDVEKLMDSRPSQANGIENPVLTVHNEKVLPSVSSSETLHRRPLPLPGSTNQDQEITTGSNQLPPRHLHSTQQHQNDQLCTEHRNSIQGEHRSEQTGHVAETCTKVLGVDTGQYWTSYTNLYSQGRNLKTPYEPDKVMEKEVIPGPPSGQMGNQQQPHHHHLLHYHNHAIPQQLRQQEVQYLLSSGDISRRDPTSTSTPKPPVPINGADAGSDQGVKSSSESGRGTYVGSTPKTSSVQLDSSLDSDQSVGALWRQRAHSPFRTDQASLDQIHHGPQHNHQHPHLHNPWASDGHLDLKSGYASTILDGACSENTAFSVTPPLPPTTPPPPNATSPVISPTRKNKKSISTPALASNYGSRCGQGSEDPIPRPATAATRPNKRTSGTGGRKSTCPPGSTYRMWEQGKMRSYSKNTNGRHGYSYGATTGSRGYNTYDKNKDYKIQIEPSHQDLGDGDVTSTTTALDMESLLDDDDDEEEDDGGSSDVSCCVMTEDTEGAGCRDRPEIHKQIQGLETMYGEILKLLGMRSGTGGRSKVGSSADLVKAASRRHHRHHGSFSSLSGRPSAIISSNSRHRDRRQGADRTTRHARDTKNSPLGKRLQRLESHVVTLARSVAHLSSEMRTQHVLVQELESIRQDLTWIHDQIAVFGPNNHLKGRHGGHRSSHHQLAQNNPGGNTKEWERFRCELLELINPGRVRKLTKFFGDEPPLLRQFLKKLGYEKYASNFESERIGITELPYLTEERLQKIGIPMGPRVRILQEAQQSFRQDNLNIYIV